MKFKLIAITALLVTLSFSTFAQKISLAIQLQLPSDSEGMAGFDIVDTNTQEVVTKFYQVEEGEVEIYSPDGESAGILEIEDNKIYIGDLLEGETLKVLSMKLTNLTTFSAVYIVDVAIPLDGSVATTE